MKINAWAKEKNLLCDFCLHIMWPWQKKVFLGSEMVHQHCLKREVDRDRERTQT